MLQTFQQSAGAKLHRTTQTKLLCSFFQILKQYLSFGKKRRLSHHSDPFETGIVTTSSPTQDSFDSDFCIAFDVVTLPLIGINWTQKIS